MSTVIDERLQNFDFEAALSNKLPSTVKRAQVDGPLLSDLLALEYTNLGVGTIEAEVTLQAQHCRCSPLGYILHGGASLAIAENIAGFGSSLLCHVLGYNNLTPVGVSVTANHISMALYHERLRIKATAIQQGHTLHVWNIDLLHSSNGSLVSSVRVTNALIEPRQPRPKESQAQSQR